MAPGPPRARAGRRAGDDHASVARMFRWASITVAACVAGLAGAAAPPTAEPDVLVLTPLEAVARALADHPALVEQGAVLEEREARILEAYATVYPEIDVLASVVRNRDPGLLNSPNFSDPGIGFDPAFLQPIPVTTYDYRIAVDQLVYSFGKVSKAVRAARVARASEDDRLDGVRLLVARNAQIAFVGLARAKATFEVVTSEREALERQVQRADDLLEVGAGTRLQRLQAGAALAGLRKREIDAEGAVRTGRGVLNEAIGRDPELGVDIDLSWLADAEIPELPPVERLLEASARRPDLEALDKDADVLGRLAGIERSRLLPEFRFTGSMGVRTIDTAELANDEFASWDAGLYFEWTLFDGKASRARALQYEAQRRQTEARADGARRLASREMLEAVDSYERGVASFDVATSAVAEAEEARRVAEESMRWGAATTLDVLESERTLRLVRLQRVEALHDVLVSYAQIRFLVGMLPGEPWPDDLTTEAGP